MKKSIAAENSHSKIRFAITTRRIKLRNETNEVTFIPGVRVSVWALSSKLEELGIYWCINDMGYSGKVYKEALKFEDDDNSKR